MFEFVRCSFLFYLAERIEIKLHARIWLRSTALTKFVAECSWIKVHRNADSEFGYWFSLRLHSWLLCFTKFVFRLIYIKRMIRRITHSHTQNQSENSVFFFFSRKWNGPFVVIHETSRFDASKTNQMHEQEHDVKKPNGQKKKQLEIRHTENRHQRSENEMKIKQ